MNGDTLATIVLLLSVLAVVITVGVSVGLDVRDCNAIQTDLGVATQWSIFTSCSIYLPERGWVARDKYFKELGRNQLYEQFGKTPTK